MNDGVTSFSACLVCLNMTQLPKANWAANHLVEIRLCTFFYVKKLQTVHVQIVLIINNTGTDNKVIEF